jgi:hypothetical protein
MSKLPHPSVNGQSNKATTKARKKAARATRQKKGREERGAALLKEAKENPGSAKISEIPEREIGPGRDHVTEIKPRELDPGVAESGQVLFIPPAIMTVSLGRPNPDGFVQLHPERSLHTALVAYKSRKDASAEFYYVVPGLEGPLQKNLLRVNVHLVSSLDDDCGVFLWIVLASEFSPYHNSVQRILAQGEGWTKHNKVRFMQVVKKERRCLLLSDPIGPDDPKPVLPSRPVSVLLPEALREEERIIADTSHPVYRALTRGRAL